ncbi:putative bifunctional diguanylate cyclase/phosphodiesterase, partial [Uliginosibacterium paludis]
ILEAACERILNILGQPYVIGDLLLNACGSIGVACFPTHGTTVESLTKRADIALYRAKRQGRSLYRFFDSGMELDLYNRDSLEKALRAALKTRQLELRFQLQVDRNLRPIGAEALLRWHHPVRGLIGAMEFLPDAVASGLVHDIDNLVLENACATLGKWQHDPELRGLSLSVNITARAFDSPSIAPAILALLAKFGVPPEKLCLEITEQLETRSFVTANTAITHLREQGVRIALDDCGTGFSSLESLKSLSFDQVKIDGVFIRDINTNTVSQAIVAGLIGICRAMGLQVLAECVETPDQMEYLLEAGVDGFQGYLFGMPLPCAVLEAGVRDAPQSQRG